MKILFSSVFFFWFSKYELSGIKKTLSINHTYYLIISLIFWHYLVLNGWRVCVWRCVCEARVLVSHWFSANHAPTKLQSTPLPFHPSPLPRHPYLSPCPLYFSPDTPPFPLHPFPLFPHPPFLPPSTWLGIILSLPPSPSSPSLSFPSSDHTLPFPSPFPLHFMTDLFLSLLLFISFFLFSYISYLYIINLKYFKLHMSLLRSYNAIPSATVSLPLPPPPPPNPSLISVWGSCCEFSLLHVQKLFCSRCSCWFIVNVTYLRPSMYICLSVGWLACRSVCLAVCQNFLKKGDGGFTSTLQSEHSF